MNQIKQHEIANQLMSSSLNIHYLMKQCEDASLKRYLSGLQNNLENLADLCGLEPKEASPAQWRLEDMLNDLITSVAGIFMSRGITLITEFESASLEFVENRLELQRILMNLLKNSAEYSDLAAEVVFRCHTKAGNIVFEIENLNGPTFNHEKTKTRVEEQRVRGLGLGIVGENTAKLGGQFLPVIKETGMLMRVSLPIINASPANILIIDDQECFCEAAKLWLEELGFSVIYGNHDIPEEGTKDFDFYIIDVNFGTGFATYNRCQLPKDQTIFISGSQAMLNKAKVAGFKTALKGPSLDDLMEHITEVA